MQHQGRQWMEEAGHPDRHRGRRCGAGQARHAWQDAERRAASRQQAQRGFSLIEVSIVTAIVLLIAVIGIPAIGGYVLENKVPKVGQELARFVMHTRVNAGTSGDPPYAGIGTTNLATMVADSTVLTRAADGTILHGLGGGGAIEVEPDDAGAGFLLRLSRVNHVACPSIASVLQRVADRITVSADGGATRTVKDDATPYSALSAESACAKGDANQFVFYVR
ncbi:type 4 pilus major pilin [Castellaniella sp.]|uniref:type 4 pilus major pilin n=1 Tax=Castellaniella sp. TaxID=1955812 RepID=UPI003C7370A0